jgi:hypothetical protein
MATNTRKQGLYAGHTFFTVLNNDGTPKFPTFGIMCAETMTYTPSFNRVDVPSGCIEDYNQPIETFQIPEASTVDVTLKETTPKAFAMNFMGEAITKTEPAVAIVGATFVVPHDDWFRPESISNMKYLDAFDIAGSDIKIDYRYHKASGYMKIVDGGNLAVGSNITFDATRTARIIQVIDALSVGNILVDIEWYGEDIKTKEPISLHIARANLVPTQGINFQSTTPQVITLTGTAESVVDSPTAQVRIG